MDKLKEFTQNKIFKSCELVRAYFHDETYDYTPLHTHDFYELNIVISGDGIHRLNDSDCHITTGDIFNIPPGISHGYTFDSPKYSIFHLLFKETFFKKYGAELKNISGYHILFNIDSLVRANKKVINNFLHVNIKDNYNLMRILNELALLENTNNGNVEHKKEYLVLYVVAKICEAMEDKKNTFDEKNRYLFDLLKSVEYIHINYGEKIELKTLYTISCMSRSSYIHHFKELFGCPPIDYIQDYRLNQAKSMLQHTSKPLTAIANDCGFCDSAHFSRLFKEKYHVSPSKYRTILD